MSVINTFSGCCRGCMTVITSQEHCSKQTLVLEMFMHCTGLQVSDEEGLPKNFCSKCCDKIDLCFHFIEQARKSDITMRNLLSCAETGVIIIQRESITDPADSKVQVKYEQNEYEPNACTIYYDDFTQYSTKDEDNSHPLEYFDEEIIEAEVVYSENENISEENIETNTIEHVEEIKPSNAQFNTNVYNIKLQDSWDNANECPAYEKKFVSKKWFSKHITSNKHISEENVETDVIKPEEEIKPSNARLTTKVYNIKLKDSSVNVPECGKWECPTCKRKFVSKKWFIRHLTSEHSKSEEIVATKANEHVEEIKTSNARLTRKVYNILQDSSGNVNECPTCKKKFTTKKWFIKHMTSEHSHSMFSCNICSKQFKQRYLLRDHMRTHSDERPFACNTCSKQFKQPSLLREHMTIHSDERPYACHICPSLFKKQRQLGIHLRTHQEHAECICHVCNAKFQSKDKIRMHLRIHSELKSHLCHVCGVGFIMKNNLAQHMRTHTGEKPFACTKCDFRCSLMCSLRRHERKHTGERPYPCNFCDKTFLDWTHRKTHMLGHTGERPYPCNLCGGAFVSSGKRKRHMFRQHKIPFSGSPLDPQIALLQQQSVPRPGKLEIIKEVCSAAKNKEKTAKKEAKIRQKKKMRKKIRECEDEFSSDY